MRITSSLVNPVAASLTLVSSLTATIELGQFHLGNRPISDSVSGADHSIITSSKAITDVTSLADVTVIIVSSAVADTVDMSDSSHTTLSKVLVDTALVSETIVLAAVFARSFTDAVNLTDSIDSGLVEGLINNDTTATTDFASFTLGSVVVDGLTPSDTTTFTFGQTHTDSTLIADAYAYAISKRITDFVGASDVIHIQLTSNKTPVFNRITFNSSTFG